MVLAVLFVLLLSSTMVAEDWVGEAGGVDAGVLYGVGGTAFGVTAGVSDVA